MKIADISIRQPVFITMIMLAIVVIGIVSYERLPVELFPDITLPIVAVSTVYPGAGPEEVEVQVTKPIEEVLSSLNGIDNIKSTSSEGVSVVVVSFKLEVNPDRASTDVRDKIASVVNKLPTDVIQPVISKFDPSASPILAVGVSGKDSLADPQKIRSRVEDDLEPALERIEGVAQVEIIGGLEREVQVNVDFEKLTAHNISILQVSQVLAAENLNLPAGRVTEGSHELLFRTQAEFVDVGEIGGIIVASPGGVPVYLRDIAQITDSHKEVRTISRLNDKPSVLFQVRKQSGTNTVAVAEALKKKLAELKGGSIDPVEAAQIRAKAIAKGAVPPVDRFPELVFKYSFDESGPIKDSRDDVFLTLILGALLAGVVVFISFGDIRNTLITIAGLPICIIGSAAVIYALGFSINIITLLAMSLSVGLLIDDAIVVRENIFRRMNQYGEKAPVAASHGTAEVALAVTATTLSLLAVFLPISFITGMAGKFMRQFGITIAAAVAISYFEAFTFAPMLSAYFFRVVDDSKRSTIGRWAARLATVYDSLNDIYLGALGWALSHRKSIVAIACLFMAATFFFISLVGTGGSPRGDRPDFNVVLEYASGTTLAKSDSLTRQIEAILHGYPQVNDLFTVIGSSDGSVDQATILVRLKKGNFARAFQDKLRPVFVKLPGIKATFTDVSGFSGNAASSSLQQLPIQLQVQGDDLDEITNVANEIKSRIRKVPALVDLGTDVRAARPELQLEVDRDQATRLGVSTAQLAMVLRTFVSGQIATQFRSGEKEIDVRVRLREDDRQSAAQLAALMVPTVYGTQIPLAQVAKIRLESGPTQINRQDRVRQVVVGGNVAKNRALGDVLADVKKALASMKMPAGVTMLYGGQAKSQAESFAALFIALLLGIVFVYMVLASEFESFVQPFTIMTALPLSLVGAAIALLAAQRNFDMMAFIGLILLMGLVTKNSILLIDYVNQGRRRGLDRRAAILDAGHKRLRPILMTTIAMILGMVPVALSFGTSSEFRVSMAVTIIGGLVSSTLLTLVIIPVTYTIIDDWFGRKHRMSDDIREELKAAE